MQSISKQIVRYFKLTLQNHCSNAIRRNTSTKRSTCTLRVLIQDVKLVQIRLFIIMQYDCGRLISARSSKQQWREDTLIYNHYTGYFFGFGDPMGLRNGAGESEQVITEFWISKQNSVTLKILFRQHILYCEFLNKNKPSDRTIRSSMESTESQN